MFSFIYKFLIQIYTYKYRPTYTTFWKITLQCMAISFTFFYTYKFIKFMCNTYIPHPCFAHNLIKHKTHSPCVHVYIQNHINTCQTMVISVYKNLIQFKELWKKLHLFTSYIISTLTAKIQNYATRTGDPHVFETASNT